jgi:putative ABC transport system substrate-binding protein
MKRRAFVTLLGGAVALWPIAARAQQPSRIWRVGYLSPEPPSEVSRALFGAFRLRLQELGYVEGRNLILDVRRADGDSARLPGLAAELVALRPDVVVAVFTSAIAAAQKATSSIPIVMLGIGDPIGSGFIRSLARPGGNITGLSYMSPDINAKSLELLLSVVPGAKRVGVLMSDNPTHAPLIPDIHALAQTLGVEILPVTWTLPADLDEAFEKIGMEKCDGLIVLADTKVPTRIAELAAKIRIPAIYQTSGFVRRGGLLSYSPDAVDLWRRAAVYVDKLLKGAAPADLPVEQPTKFELLVNLKTAKALGLSIPDSVLVRANEVIE